MESSTYPNDKLIAMSRNFVNVVCHHETGHDREVVIGREKKLMCSKYWGIACDVHSRLYQEAGNTYEGITGVPCTVFADPTGKELFREAGGLGASELIDQMEKALKQVPGEKIPYEIWAAAKKQVADGEAAFAKEDFKKAVEAWTKVAKMKLKGVKALGEEALKKAEEKGNELLQEGESKIESEKEEAKKILKKVADQFKPLECAKKAAELLKGLGKGK
ncbi:MAG: hypothetical protein HYY16_15535 [Planctomycetes bacterium]|nr:hypothetical protein [Planctomycetota bacterium]